MSQTLRHFFETMFFAPQWYHRLVSILLVPLSLLYGIGMFLRRKCVKQKQFSLPIISVGNLIVGGSGKTPFCIALATHYQEKHVAIISRGYGRQSNGLIEVSREGEIGTTVEQSGDEAMLMAISLPYASIIVSESREEAILLAQKRGVEMIVLDDGFNRVEIEKFEILLEPPEIPNTLPFPSGPLREFLSTGKEADMVLKESSAFIRQVSYENLTPKMVLLTAISNPSRLEKYLPKGVVYRVYLEDHAYFEEAMLDRLFRDYQASSFLVTQKDSVKMKQFKYPISLMKLELRIQAPVFKQIETYLQEKDNKDER